MLTPPLLIEVVWCGGMVWCGAVWCCVHMEHVRLGWDGGLVRSGVEVGGVGMKCGVPHAECVKIGNGETVGKGDMARLDGWDQHAVVASTLIPSGDTSHGANVIGIVLNCNQSHTHRVGHCQK